MIIDKGRKGRFDMVVNSLNDSNTHEQSTLDEGKCDPAGATMTVVRIIRARMIPESQLVQGNWRDIKTTLQPIRLGLGPVCPMMLSEDGL
jgi:hypothetical protein